MSFTIWSRPADHSEDGRIETFEQFRDAVNYLEEQVATWNNFIPEKVLEIRIEKPIVENTLGVNVSDKAPTSDHFGGR